MKRNVNHSRCMLSHFVAIVFLLLQLWSSAPTTAAESVGTLFSRARHTFRLIDTIEFEQTFNVAEKTQRARFLAKQNKFLNETTLDTANLLAVPDNVVAFDGVRHQDLSVIAKNLYVSRAPQDIAPVGVKNALTVPFFWLAEQGRGLTLADIREAANWERVERNAKLAGEKSEAQLGFYIVEIPLPSATVSVFLSPSHGYFPLKWESNRPNGQLIAGAYVKTWETFSVDGETAIVPTVVEFVTTVGGTTPHLHTCYINVIPETLKVNHSIGDDIFTISPTRAEEVIDVDAEAREQSRMEPKGSWGTLYGSLLVSTVVVGVVALVWYLRRR